MSRERRSLRFAPAVVGIALALAGCSAGQISQTASMEAAVNGSNANIGSIAVRDIQLAYPEHGVYKADELALVLGSIVNSGQTADELVSITSPAGEIKVDGDKSLPPGRSLIAELPAGGITKTPVATTPSNPATTSGAPTTSGSAATSGSATATSGSATSGSATSGSATSGSSTTTATTTATSTTSSAPKSIGKVTIMLTLKEELRSGKNVELTFTFRSGQVTVLVPIAVPTTPRKPAVTEGH